MEAINWSNGAPLLTMRTILTDDASKEAKGQHMAKTATFGIMHVVTSYTVTYSLTGNMAVAGIVTVVEPLVNTVMHYFFDKYWEHPSVEAIRAAVARVVRGVDSADAARQS
jgi:uncharacterized membrane protein